MTTFDSIKKCSNDARSIIIRASNICEILGHPQLRLEHFMLALLKYHKDKGLFILKKSKVNVDKLINAIYFILPPFNPVKSYLFQMELKEGERKELTWSNSSSKMLIMSLKEAERLSSNLIEPEHILLAITLCARGRLQKILKKIVE